MNKLTCPVCGSKNLEIKRQLSHGEITSGPSFTFEEVYYKCNTCQEETDPSGETDKNYLAAQKNAQKQFVLETINDLSKNNIKMLFFEKVFELPIRTLSRWKKGDFSASSLALLRIVKALPWIIYLAEREFDTRAIEVCLTNLSNYYTANNEEKINLQSNRDLDFQFGGMSTDGISVYALPQHFNNG
ncbi:MAG: hypothetical protein CMF39_04965 [Legionellaceae bacterium]|nr:hypothetical protein [Legionellaceae bacterium]|tara:strand:+ start:249 stop:809 length:561 start_codon:yes stop_codon:yes gene_type:complete